MRPTLLALAFVLAAACGGGAASGPAYPTRGTPRAVVIVR